MIQFKEALKLLEKSKEFQGWKKKNPETCLSYGFFAVEDADTDWKIGYYHKKKDKMTSFNVGKKVTVEPEEDILKQDKSEIGEINPKDVKLDLSDAVTVACDLQREEFATENPRKIVAILQKLEMGQVWNITFLTQTFNTLNFKIKSENGRVVEKKLQPLFQMDK